MEMNERIFRKYNREEDIVRCPYGRAKVRDLLHDYAFAAMNLYGIIALEDLVEIFNAQTEYETNVDELYIMLLPIVFKDNHFIFYKNNLVEYSARGSFKAADTLIKIQEGKPRYIPEREEFLKYLNGYYDDNPYRIQLIEQLREINAQPSKIEEIYLQLETATGINEGLEIINNYNLIFDSQEVMEEFVEIYVEWHNNRRLWDNKGHRASELFEMEAESKKENPEEMIEIDVPKKIGRNDPCPCGRGKKYKKCCLKYDAMKTAQLSAEDKKLFFEIYLSLMNFVNEKKRVVNFTFDPLHSEANPQQLTVPVRQLLIEQPKLISEYLEVTDLSSDKKEILASWQEHFVEKKYMIADYKDEYAILMDISEGDEGKLYGVKGISHSIATAVLRPLPVLISAVVLPFKDELIYDSLIAIQNISYSSTISQSFIEAYQNLLKSEGITSQFN